ncbi:MAG: Flp pilus assembly complex ATPase component TadA [Nanoarchaeota archaeon]|nr:Flp pilus assembly complex ATPase component TadA [Nanoarchaeota archaeon]
MADNNQQNAQQKPAQASQQPPQPAQQTPQQPAAQQASQGQQPPSQQPTQPPSEAQQQAPSPKKKKSLIDWLLGKKTEEELKTVETASAYKPLFKIAFPNEIPVLPEPKDISKIDVRYKVIEPFVDIHIYWDAKNNELAYEVEEPKLTEQETKDLRIIEEGLTELINISYINIEDMNIVIEFLEKNLKIILDEFGIKVSEETFLKYMYFLYRDLIGMNQVEPLLKDYFIEDIECNGVGTPIYIVHRKYRNLRTNIGFSDIRILASFVEKLAQKCSQYVSYANPLLDGVLPDGSLDYNEQFIYKQNGVVHITKIGEFIDKFYSHGNSNKPVTVEDIEVPSFDPQTLKISWRKADYVYRHKINGKLYKLELETGRTVALTGAHSIFKLTPEGVKAEKTENMCEGEYVAIPLSIPENDFLKEINAVSEIAKTHYAKKVVIGNVPKEIFEKKRMEIKAYLDKNYKHPYEAYYELRKKQILPVKLYGLLPEEILRKCKLRTTSSVAIPTFITVSKELMRFLGYYTAEGWPSNTANAYYIQFCLNKNETHLIEDIKQCAETCFGLGTYVEPPVKGGVKVKVNSFLLWILFTEVLGIKKGAKNKDVPSIVFNVSKELQRNFIKAWWDGNYGYTVSNKLISDVLYLSLFDNKVISYQRRLKEAVFDKCRPVSSWVNYTQRMIERPSLHYPTMIPMEIFNPLNEFGNKLKHNKRIDRARLRKILADARYKRLADMSGAYPKQFYIEWQNRGVLNNTDLTEKGKKIVEEIKFMEKLLDSDLGFVKVKKISNVNSAKDFVYDISVGGCENFIGGVGGICCHNSRVNATYTEDVTSHGPTFCITEGNVQLDNGVVKDIRELFDECRANFECIESGGDEIIEMDNFKVCGVRAENLKQIPANITKIMKLKPPEELVNVELNDGAKLCVTKNHLFHVADDTLKLVQAADLKEGMLIPVPSLVACEGSRQTIDVWNLLKEFSIEKKVCIVSSEAVKSLVSMAVGSGRCCAKACDYGVHESYFYEVISRGCSISFNILDRICTESNALPDSLGEMRIVVYGGGSKGKPKDISIPKAVDEELAYLAGAVISDGHLSRASIDVSCFEEGFMEAVKSALVSKFGNCETYYGGSRVYLCNLFVPYYFNKVFGIQFGKKSSIVRVPEIIFRSDNKVVAAFVRGLFDGDGTCSSGLSYKTNSGKLAEGISYLLARLGIYCYLDNKEGQYKVTIPSIYEAKYSETIGFNNKFKAEKLRLLLGKKSEHKSHINHGRVPAKPVLSLLKEIGISKNFIIKETGVSYNRLVYYDTISKPFANKIVEILEAKLTGEAKFKMSHLLRLNYIKWLANNSYEYVRVKKAEICDNADKLNVYDIELEPCKFYIGGNKPMVLFDTIRKFTKEPWTPIKLMDFKTVSPEILAYLWLLIENKSNILVIGGTGSGKTSFLNAIAFFIPPAARVVSIEDTRELNLRHENWLPAVSRAGAGTSSMTGEKHGEVSLFDLLKESLRQRPDYIIVGEIRGKEAFVLFQGMNTGHPSFGTMHAESTDTVIKRLTMPPISLSPSMVEALDALCIIAPAKVNGKDVRRISRIDELVSVDEKGNSKINVPFVRDPAKDVFLFKTGSKVFEKIMKRTGMQWKDLLKEFENRTRLLMEMYRRKIFGFAEVQDIISEYYKKPDMVLKRFGLIK